MQDTAIKLLALSLALAAAACVGDDPAHHMTPGQSEEAPTDEQLQLDDTAPAAIPVPDPGHQIIRPGLNLVDDGAAATPAHQPIPPGLNSVDGRREWHAPPMPVVVSVLDPAGAPIPDVTAYFERADGSIDTVSTDASGLASSIMVGGGSVTLDLDHWVGVKQGDRIVFHTPQ